MKKLTEVKQEIIRLFWKIDDYNEKEWDFGYCRGAIEALCWAYELPIGKKNFIKVLTSEEEQ